MFKKRNLLFLFLLILGVFLISGCWLISTPTYTITYNGNGHTGGSLPTDSTVYKENDTFTLLDKGDLAKTGYTFAGWNTEADGSGTDHAVGSTFTMGVTDVTLYAKWTPLYALRDIGPAGGLIFYVKEGGYSDGWMYLEAAPATTEWTDKQWGSYGTEIGGTGIGIGSGQSNTTTIVTWLDNNTDDTYGDVTNKTDRVAYLCDALTLGGYSDWFLPSKDELSEMYTELNIAGVGGFGDYGYWSSSEYDANDAWGQGFSDGYQYNYGYKNDYRRVRAVRVF